MGRHGSFAERGHHVSVELREKKISRIVTEGTPHLQRGNGGERLRKTRKTP